AIRSFDFSSNRPLRSLVLEIDDVAVSMERMKQNLASFMEISGSLSAQTQFQPLLELILKQIVEIAEADGGILYLAGEDDQPASALELILDGVSHAPDAFGLDQRKDRSTAPDWLALPLAGGTSETRSLGFDAAGILQPLLHALDC